MSRRVKCECHRPDALWLRETEIVINGRNVVPGTELSIRGERGRFHFIERVTTEKMSTWISVIGGPKGERMFRSFNEDRVKTVHWKNKLRESA